MEWMSSFLFLILKTWINSQSNTVKVEMPIKMQKEQDSSASSYRSSRAKRRSQMEWNPVQRSWVNTWRGHTDVVGLGSRCSRACDNTGWASGARAAWQELQVGTSADFVNKPVMPERTPVRLAGSQAADGGCVPTQFPPALDAGWEMPALWACLLPQTSETSCQRVLPIPAPPLVLSLGSTGAAEPHWESAVGWRLNMAPISQASACR